MKARRILMMLALMLSMAASAQNADQLYEEGKALYDAKDYAAAVTKLRPAAEKGHKKAQYRLARCYDKGHGVEENNAEAFKWYSKSAGQGYAKAEYQVARAYLKGKGVEADEKKAKSYLKKAVSGKKHGQEIMDDIREKAAEGDKTASKMLTMLGK
ncbi:MAG: tetratricopeptide repeat protein [Prevotella sp.]